MKVLWACYTEGEQSLLPVIEWRLTQEEAEENSTRERIEGEPCFKEVEETDTLYKMAYLSHEYYEERNKFKT